MAEPLKNQYGPEIPRRIAHMIAAVDADFDTKRFLQETLNGYEELNLMPRGWKIARTLRNHLPEDYKKALKILMASLGPKREKIESAGMSSFLYMPHIFFVAEYGLDHFDLSMQAQYELTQRFTAEFSIRPFIERHPEKSLLLLKSWTSDPSEHVRRLVSEGTRPRLPWAPRLRNFQKDPRPVLALLEHLKDDPSLYVRRSVANNLNDIGKDHPDLLAKTARTWLKGASKERQWLVQHALRSAIKRAEASALNVLGFGTLIKISVLNVKTTPARPQTGDTLRITCELLSKSAKPQAVLADLRIHYVKASGRTSPKVFKLKTIQLAPKEKAFIKKTISLAEKTTRKHYPGTHTIDLILNGKTYPLTTFNLAKK